ncbi:unnamed protein product [Dibothriocephalus latus]|uniref:Uncharacterized protein n=1 Tax=Dibothriocephalus latus TaxID=60516 RepID=A0A3P7LFC8_DIBLA|nr:unnamed protein product [Dibothriocephalus latus]
MTGIIAPHTTTGNVAEDSTTEMVATATTVEDADTHAEFSSLTLEQTDIVPVSTEAKDKTGVIAPRTSAETGAKETTSGLEAMATAVENEEVPSLAPGQTTIVPVWTDAEGVTGVSALRTTAKTDTEEGTNGMEATATAVEDEDTNEVWRRIPICSRPREAKMSKLNLRSEFFTQRAIQQWNNLPQPFVEATSLQMYKHSLDNYMRPLSSLQV